MELVSPEYFTALHIPLAKGRLWDKGEISRGAMLVLVNQAFVRQYLGGGDATGHSVQFPRFANLPPVFLAADGVKGWMPIIGVVADSRDDGLDKPVAPAVYFPYTSITVPGAQILVRTQGKPLALLHSVRKQIATVDPNQQIVNDVRDLEGWIQREPEFARGRLISMLFGSFAVLALVLAAVGLYSVVSFTVVRRTSELGVRVALGARRGHILRVVALSAGTSVGIGILLGLALSYGLNRYITRWVEYGANAPVLLLAVSAILVCVAALACLFPARRALAIDPMKALRFE